MAKKLSISIIAATVAASMAITPAAQAGHRGLGLGIGLGVLAVGAMAHQAKKAEAQQRARARAQAQAQARAKAQAQARAKAQAQARAQAKAAAAAKQQAAAQAEDANKEEVAETTGNTSTTPSTYVPAASSSAALTQVDVDQANATPVETPVETATVATVDETPAATTDVTSKDEAAKTCKKYVPALGVAVDVGC